MSKSMLVLVGFLAVAGSAYAWRQDLDRVLPAPLAKAAHAVLAVAGVPANEPDSGKAATPGGQAKGAAPSKKGGGPAPVNVATAQLADMPIILSAPGTVEALATVAIKPRVDGQVIEVGFKEGDMVEAGSVLYRLDQRLVSAQIKQAEAQITRDQASLKDAMSILDRRESLLVKKYASEASTDTARQQVEVLKATIAASRAALEMQRTQLDYLVIRAPITGRTGSMTAKLGAFVRSADPLPLLTINQTKPIAVAFALPQANLQQLKEALDKGADAAIKVPGAKPMTVSGKLSFVDNQVDKTTGTVTAKVIVENAAEILWPGLAVHVDLIAETRRGMVSVPASAVLPAQEGMISWVAGADNKVAVRAVVVDRVIEQTAYLVSGLKPGERVVSDGQLRLSPGAAVSIRAAPGAKGSAGTTGASRAPGKAAPSEAPGNAGGG